MASKIVFDALAGEQFTVELTPEEVLAMQSTSGQEDTPSQDDAIRASARAKLAAIGLTEAEITALVGG